MLCGELPVKLKAVIFKKIPKKKEAGFTGFN